MTQQARLTRDELNRRALTMVKMRCDAGMTLQAIGNVFGLTRERVRQELKAKCGIDCQALPETNKVYHRVEVECAQCSKVFEVAAHQAKRQKHYFCSKRCCYEYVHPLYVCDRCGREFRRTRSQMSVKLGGSRKDPRYQGGKYCSEACYHGRNVEAEEELSKLPSAVVPEDLGRPGLARYHLREYLRTIKGLTREELRRVATNV